VPTEIGQSEQGGKHRRWKESILKKAARKNNMRALDDLTAVVDRRHLIVPKSPCTMRIDDKLAGRHWDEIPQFFESYKQSLPLARRVLLDQFWRIDVARKVVGVGSVGTRCLLVLLQANDRALCFSNSSRRPSPYSNSVSAAAFLNNPASAS
jgi:hypothetical protein